MIVYKNGTRQLTANFSETEVFSKSSDSPDQHWVSPVTLAGLQFIRSHYGKAVRITSSYRTATHQAAIGSSLSSMHFNYKDPTTGTITPGGNGAFDARFVIDNSNNLKTLYADWRAKGPVYQQLRSIGVTSFGMYDNFFHVDDGGGHGVNINNRYHDQHGPAAMWDLTVLLKEDEKKNLGGHL